MNLESLMSRYSHRPCWIFLPHYVQLQKSNSCIIGNVLFRNPYYLLISRRFVVEITAMEAFVLAEEIRTLLEVNVHS